MSDGSDFPDYFQRDLHRANRLRDNVLSRGAAEQRSVSGVRHTHPAREVARVESAHAVVPHELVLCVRMARTPATRVISRQTTIVLPKRERSSPR